MACQNFTAVELSFSDYSREWILEIDTPDRQFVLKSCRGPNDPQGKAEIRTWYSSIMDHIEKQGRPKSQIDQDRREIDKGFGLPLNVTDNFQDATNDPKLKKKPRVNPDCVALVSGSTPEQPQERSDPCAAVRAQDDQAGGIPTSHRTLEG